MTFVPRALIAEVTHRCPLRCVYCSNPLEMRSRSTELSTAEWQRVFGEAAALGVLQLHLTGGEPLARPDAEQLVKAGRAAGLYVNLITSGIGLAEARLEGLVAAGSPAPARMRLSSSSPSASGNIASPSP
jgi:pyrroloquinoline quinone biosynthesis protein E